MSASWQDRDGAKTTLLSTCLTSSIRHVFADQGFAGRLVDWAAETLKTTVEIVRKPADQRGFVVRPVSPATMIDLALSIDRQPTRAGRSP